MGKLVEVVNTSSVARSIEFLNDEGVYDSCTVFGRSSISIDEDNLTTSTLDLQKRGLKIVESLGSKLSAPEERKAQQPNYPKDNHSNNNHHHQHSAQSKKSSPSVATPAVPVLPAEVTASNDSTPQPIDTTAMVSS